MAEDVITGTSNPRLKEGQERYAAWKDSNSEKKWREQAIKEIHYYTGEDQGWDDRGARDALLAENRPALTLNRINPVIRLIQGARPDTDVKYIPTEEGDLQTAEIFNECKVHVEGFNKWEFKLDEWFVNGLVKLRQVVEIMPDYSKGPLGEIGLNVRDGFEFILDPNSKEKDRSDADGLIEELIITPGQAKKAFPKHKKKIDELVGYVKGGEAETTSRDSGEPDEYNDSRANYYDAVSNKVKIVRYWYKDEKETTKAIDTLTDDVIDDLEDDEVDVLMKADPERFYMVPMKFTTVKFITFIYDIVLEEGTNPWEREDGQPTRLSENFPFIIFEPDRLTYGNRQDLISLIDPLTDAQTYHNKLASLVLEIIGAGVKNGVDYEKGALSKESKDKLKKDGARAGAAVEWEQGAISGGKFKYRQNTTNPQAEIMQAREMAEILLSISGVESLVSTEQLGKGASGVAIDLKMKQGSSIIKWVYESFRFFQFQLAEYIRDAIQVLFDYEKVIRIKGEPPKYVRINEQVFDPDAGIAEIMNDVTIGNYDVGLTDKELMPSMRLERLRSITELAKSGGLVLPPPVMTTIILHLLDDLELKTLVEEELARFQEQQAAMMQAGGVPQQQLAA